MQAAGDRYDIGTGRGPMDGSTDLARFQGAPVAMFPPAPQQAVPDRTEMDAAGAAAMPSPAPQQRQTPARPRPASRPRGPLPTLPEMPMPPDVGIPQGGFPMPDMAMLPAMPMGPMQMGTEMPDLPLAPPRPPMPMQPPGGGVPPIMPFTNAPQMFQRPLTPPAPVNPATIRR
jgi:hypothetical protein